MSPRANPAERLRRLLAMMPWLAARGTATFEEIAERFSMDVDAVEDELWMAACCGLPPYSPDRLIELQIDDDGVTARIPSYFRRPLRLTAADGFAILAAGQALLAAPGSDEAGPLASALAKLGDVLGGGDGSGAGGDGSGGSGGGGVAVDFDAPARLSDLQEAVAARERVAVEYYSAQRDEVTSREVDPLKVFADRGRWYVGAYCHATDRVLTFRVDRVRSLRRTGETFDPAAYGPLPAVGSGFRFSPDIPHATLLLPPSARWVVETYPTEAVAEVAGRPGWLRVRLAVTGMPWLERLLLRVGPEGQVEDPPELATAGAGVARRLLARYGE